MESTLKTLMTRTFLLRFALPIVAVALTRLALIALSAYGLTHWPTFEARLVAVVALAAFFALHFYARNLRFDAKWAAHALHLKRQSPLR